MRKLASMFAMLAMMGGANLMGFRGAPSVSRPRPRKATKEEIEEAGLKFHKALDLQNAERKVKFPKFKVFEVHGVEVVAFSQKNAHRDFHHLLGNYGLKIVEKPTEEIKTA